MGSGSAAYYEGNVSHFSTWVVGQSLDTVTVKGRVVNESGSGFAWCPCLWVGADYSGYSVVASDESGNFALPVKANAKVVVIASLNEFRSETVITTGSADVSLGNALQIADASVMRIELDALSSLTDVPDPQAANDPNFCCKHLHLVVPFKSYGRFQCRESCSRMASGLIFGSMLASW